MIQYLCNVWYNHIMKSSTDTRLSGVWVTRRISLEGPFSLDRRTFLFGLSQIRRKCKVLSYLVSFRIHTWVDPRWKSYRRTGSIGWVVEEMDDWIIFNFTEGKDFHRVKVVQHWENLNSKKCKIEDWKSMFKVRDGMLLFLRLLKSQKESDRQSWLNWQNYTIFRLKVYDLLKYSILAFC